MKISEIINYMDSNKPKTDDDAKRVLTKTHSMIKKLKLDKKYFSHEDNYFLFLARLLPLCVEIKNKEYLLLYRDLYSLLHYETATQPRVWYNLMDILLPLKGQEYED